MNPQDINDFFFNPAIQLHSPCTARFERLHLHLGIKSDKSRTKKNNLYYELFIVNY